MTPQNAIQVIDEATGNVLLNRKDHETVQEAIRTLQRMVNKSSETKADDPTTDTPE